MITSPRRKILILGHSTFGAKMSSPGIRARHMAEALARNLPECQITLAVPKSQYDNTATPQGYAIVPYTLRKLPGLLLSHKIIISTEFPKTALIALPFRKFVLDFFTTYLIEWMENTREDIHLVNRPARRSAWMGMARNYINLQLMQADMVLCANERQRDYFIGMMLSLGLLPESALDWDPTLKYAIRLAPHGVRSDSVVQSKAVVKGVYAGVKPDDKLLIWNGGILQWYDPLTLLQAMARICAHRDDVKLVFVGGAYPGLGSMGMGERYMEAMEMARELQLLNRNVFFITMWLPYEEMQNYLREADISVCTYFDNLETHYSLRTRYIDIFWAELPLICTHGDVLAEMVEREGLGLVVPQEDVGAVATAIERLLDDDELRERCRQNLRDRRDSLTWDVTMKPLIDYCRLPGGAPMKKWRRLPKIARGWAWYMLSRGLFFTVRRRV
jgi:glycosyltransferase involved in cell wall biosynthesis